MGATCELCGASAECAELPGLTLPLVPTLCDRCWSDETGEDPQLDKILEAISQLQGRPGLVAALNKIRTAVAEVSPFRAEPVNNVQWVPATSVTANDYNPNAVAPPEMELLRLSVAADGFTQPIVVWETTTGQYEVVDGFHRNRVGKECPEVRERLGGYLPVVIINDGRLDLGDRMAATIRHNMARGKHLIDGMAEIVLELKRRNWSDDKIGRELGMDPDEVLRLAQIQGLAEMFADEEFSRAWEVDPDTINEDDGLFEAFSQ